MSKFKQLRTQKGQDASADDSEYDTYNNETLDILEEISGLNMRREKNASEVMPANALIPTEKEFSFKGFTLTSRGIGQYDAITEADWDELGNILFRLDKSIQWLIGDWLNIGEREYGRTYEQIADLTGYKTRSLHDYAYVARSVEFSIRIENLSFGHHQVVAGMRSEVQHKWLTLADQNDWSIARLRQEINGANKPETTAAPIIDDMKREIAYIASVFADPYNADRKTAVKRVRKLRDMLDEILAEWES